MRLDAPAPSIAAGGGTSGRHGGTRTARTTSGSSRGRRNTSAPETPSRSSSPSARNARPPRARPSSTERSAASTRRPISSARARRPGPDRLIAGDAGQARRPPRQPEPDRRDHAARARRCGAPARIGEGQGGARDARRPRAQRPLARLPPRHRSRRALHGAERFSHVTHLVSEVVGELREDVRPFDLLRACFPAGTVSGAPKVRAMQLISELEATVAAVRRRGRARAAERRPGHLHRDPDDRAPRRRRTPPGRRGDRRGLRPAREHEECLRKLAALETAITLAESER